MMETSTVPLRSFLEEVDMGVVALASREPKVAPEEEDIDSWRYCVGFCVCAVLGHDLVHCNILLLLLQFI